MSAVKKAGVKPNAKAIAPKTPARVISPARKAAFHILLSVERGPSHCDDLLRGRAVSALSSADRNLATALVLGVLRWQLRLDHRIHALLTRPDAKLDAEILVALRLGAFKLFHMDRIPARAAIDESVELVKQSAHSFASGMVNAVLRKLALAQQTELDKSDLKGHDFSRAANAATTTRASAPEGKLSEEMQAHPAWIVERWINYYGIDAARAICRHGQSQPVQALRLADPTVEAELAAAGIVLEAGELLASARTVVRGDLAATAAFGAGRARLQDEGSQLVSEILSHALDRNVKSILDACAAPGGKTMILAERHPQARIVACDSSAPRLEELRRRLASLGARVECRLADATALNEDATYDLVLADLPCSGTGTLGRNPEIRHRLRLDGLARQAERQRAILAAALRALRPGGRVVYSTCSLEPEENEQVIAAVLAATPFARQLPLADYLEALRKEGFLTPAGADRLQAGLSPEGYLHLLPGAFHTDGFFIAMIEKVG